MVSTIHFPCFPSHLVGVPNVARLVSFLRYSGPYTILSSTNDNISFADNRHGALSVVSNRYCFHGSR